MAKINGDMLEALRAKISPLDTEIRRNIYRSGLFPKSDMVKDLDRRYRFDLFYVARGYEVLDGYFLDSHIETALKTIVPSLLEND